MLTLNTMPNALAAESAIPSPSTTGEFLLRCAACVRADHTTRDTEYVIHLPRQEGLPRDSTHDIVFIGLYLFRFDLELS